MATKTDATVHWYYVVDLYYRDMVNAEDVRQVKLKYEHIRLNSFSKMRVDLAAKVYSVCKFYGAEFLFSWFM